ncbi:hypothetical protein MINS_34270 [Mycolicibacterium insubricum]|jgi:anti-anti-sigma factor|uniref:Uncharacterized protein n=1 Tax=Mycolicibacterium insubricum TaxID=444597 RepID=A0A1X0DBN1_9MYCO|nr:STAS domain-containing protein [Mycolicibacterium insubricum]MCV7082209.1 STAS domain-containing protein [Mycolicibacterium insubricum]ORA69777.1 hypothetical protein BST26_12890 [Mycolicibacterium insubricum]BBZ67998.1 hypothetical protein MINS_34270 [Mycolicibacterium insubricum]
MATISPIPAVAAGRRPTASFTTTWLSPGTAVISVFGELDAASAPEFDAYADRHTQQADKIVIDLSGVAFFGTSGLTALSAFGERCGTSNVAWSLASGREVGRLLEVCDVDLPAHRTVTAALHAVRSKTTRSVKLIT